MNLDSEQSAALDLMQSGANVFLTGSAGTGKSTVTTAFIGSALRRVDIAATTGIAAINLRDQYAGKTGGRELSIGTVYRWAGFGLGPKRDQPDLEYWNWWSATMGNSARRAMTRIRRAECLVIDEISMFPGRLMNYLDFHCRMIRADARPFGGVQVICVGDFLQLPPVDKEGRGYDWAFMSRAWLAADFRPAVLTTVHRQDEREFITLLNDFRVGRISPESMRVMNSRVKMFCDSKIPRLFTHNRDVDKWNGSQLASLPGEPESFTAIVTGSVEHQRKWLVENMITPFTLSLKPEARVMVTANITSETGQLLACNGTLGTVAGIRRHESVLVRADDGGLLELGRGTWTFDPQDPESAAFSQIPLRLAWASTIHKSQGLTLDRAHIDIRSAREPGQAYVALSRVRTLAGLHLKAAPSGTFVSPAAVAFHDSLSAPAPAPAPEPCLY